MLPATAGEPSTGLSRLSAASSLAFCTPAGLTQACKVQNDRFSQVGPSFHKFFVRLSLMGSRPWEAAVQTTDTDTSGACSLSPARPHCEICRQEAFLGPGRRSKVLPKTSRCPIASVCRHLWGPSLCFARTCLGG